MRLRRSTKIRQGVIVIGRSDLMLPSRNQLRSETYRLLRPHNDAFAKLLSAGLLNPPTQEPERTDALRATTTGLFVGIDLKSEAVHVCKLSLSM